MPYRRYSIPCREIALNRPFLYIYVCINRKGEELKSDLDFGFPLGGSTRVRLLAVSRRCAYLPVPEIAIDTHRTVRLCRLHIYTSDNYRLALLRSLSFQNTIILLRYSPPRYVYPSPIFLLSILLPCNIYNRLAEPLPSEYQLFDGSINKI